MPLYQFPVAIALNISALCSALVFFLSKPKEGKIKLLEEDESLLHDPFHVTKPEDLVDGEPVGATEFWKRTRLTKLVLVLDFAIVFAIQSVGLGWSLIAADSTNFTTPILNLVFTLYVLIITVRSVSQDSSNGHFVSIVHLGALMFLASMLLGTISILPSDEQIVSLQQDSAPNYLWYMVLVLYFIALIITINIRRGPILHLPPNRVYSEKIVSTITNLNEDNVCGVVGASIWDTLLFSYTTKVVMLGYTATSLEIGDLPILSANMRATYIFSTMKHAMGAFKLKIGNWKPSPGAGWDIAYRLIRLNALLLGLEISLAMVAALLFYTPAFFLRKLVFYLESDPERTKISWGVVFSVGLFLSNAICQTVTSQLWYICTTSMQVSLRIQLNSILFAKTLVRKDVASSSGNASDDDSKKPKTSSTTSPPEDDNSAPKKHDEDEFSSKAQIMTLMTTDVDRVSEFSWHLFTLVDAPIEIVVGTIFLYSLLGVSCFWGLGVTCLFLPLNHFAGKVVVLAQNNLMKARDERVALMNEILGGIRILKFMAWERNFEAKVDKIRAKELKFQKLNFSIEILWSAIWTASPILVTLVAFWHFTVVRGETLTPSIAFTSLAIFDELKFALNALPETLIKMLQSLVSLRRIEKYLHGAEVASVMPLNEQSGTIALQSATLTWPQDRIRSASAAPSVAPTPKNRFILTDVSVIFPQGELSLICGKLGSGKTLLLLSILGEADVLAGQVICPRSPPDVLASFQDVIPPEHEWIVPNVCAYVPQSAWLRNASIKENILFNLPYVEERYQKTLEVCALVSDLKILEDGDESEIGERGVNLSGGQKARVSLARAVYSRASVLLLDDVLSAVDAHTAHHLYHECLKGDLLRGRTVVLVSHHVQLCAPGASYVVALDNGRVVFQGDHDSFYSSDVLNGLVQSNTSASREDKEEAPIPTIEESADANQTSPTTSETSSTTATITISEPKPEKKAPRKLIEEEKRAVGRIGKDVWGAYLGACGRAWYWGLFAFVFVLATLSPLAEKGWVTYWSGVPLRNEEPKSPLWYVGIYGAIALVALVLNVSRWFILYNGSIRASTVLYKRLLEGVLFANVRFHDTVSRGRLLNRFGKDFEGIDSNLPDNVGRSFMYGMSATATFITLGIVGGLPFVIAAAILGILYYQVGKVYGQTSRDMRRLESVTRSPLYSIYGETIAGVTVLRAFGASSKFLRDMLRCVDTNSNPYYWMWGVNLWLSERFCLFSSAIIGFVGLMSVFARLDASLAGFALVFANTITIDLMFLVRRFVSLEQSMVAVERVKEFCELKREAPEFVEPRPPASWPSAGHIKCDDLAIRYAPELPNVLHNISFEVMPGEKVGVLGRTGSGKSTLALSFFRFVEATEGRIMIDDIDIAKIGLTDLRSRLTIIPQDPTILSGTLRSTLDVFDEYEDAEIYEALRRVHLIPSDDTEVEAVTVNVNTFRDLDSPVSEGGENFSTGEKQLLCMARAILKRSKVLIMDEATASVDYATDELISKTIRHEFAESTILTIAHRLRTIIDYNRVMLLDNGLIVEFDTPKVLLSDPSSKFYGLCKATGKDEFATLKRLAGL